MHLLSNMQLIFAGSGQSPRLYAIVEQTASALFARRMPAALSWPRGLSYARLRSIASDSCGKKKSQFAESRRQKGAASESGPLDRGLPGVWARDTARRRSICAAARSVELLRSAQ